MNTVRLTQARRLFCNDLTPRHTQRHNMRQWVRSLRSAAIARLCQRPDNAIAIAAAGGKCPEVAPADKKTSAASVAAASVYTN